MKPLYDRIILTPIEEEKKTKGGIITPSMSKQPTKRGEVVAVGQNKDGSPLVPKEGDIVVYKDGSGSTIEHNDEEFLIMREGDALFIED